MVPHLVSIFFKSGSNYPRTFSNNQKGTSELKPITSTYKNGFQGIWKFSVKGEGGPKDLKSGPVVPPLVSIFFKSGSNYPQTFSNNQKGVSELKPITFNWSKTGFQGIWKFSVKGKGGPKDLKSGPVVPPPLWYRFFSKVVLTIPGRFQIIKKELLNLNQSLSTDKNGFQGIWKFSVKVRGDQRIWNLALWSRLW